jgi:hypothetical protein
MQTKGWTLLRILLSRFKEDLSDIAFQEAFLSDLSDREAGEILAIKSPGPQIDAILNFPSELIQNVHYSWVAETITKVPKELQPHVISLFNPKQANRLAELVGTKPFTKTLSAPVRTFLLKLFFKYFDTGTLLPKAFLPKSELSILTKISKEDLVHLIDLLGIYDLTDESRTILDNKRVKAIHHCLSPEQRKFALYCLNQREKIASSRLNLSNWNGDCDELHKRIHLRGIARLGKALSGQDPQLIWYIVHTLDTGRGHLLEKHIEKEPVPKITPALSQQVLQTLNHIKKSKSK